MKFNKFFKTKEEFNIFGQYCKKIKVKPHKFFLGRAVFDEKVVKKVLKSPAYILHRQKKGIITGWEKVKKVFK